MKSAHTRIHSLTILFHVCACVWFVHVCMNNFFQVKESCYIRDQLINGNDTLSFAVTFLTRKQSFTFLVG